MKIVDTKGLRCPAPLIKTRQALNEAIEGESVQIIIDNDTALNNIKRFLTDNRLSYTEKRESDLWLITVDRGEAIPVSDNAESYCTQGEQNKRRKTVVSVSSDVMGNGDDQLGKKLITSFFKVLPLVQPLPEAIVFYNAGVKLAAKGSPVEEYLKELEQIGVDIVLCTTCVDFFSLEDKISSGRIGDMYQIMNLLNEADNVIKP